MQVDEQLAIGLLRVNFPADVPHDFLAKDHARVHTLVSDALQRDAIFSEEVDELAQLSLVGVSDCAGDLDF